MNCDMVAQKRVYLWSDIKKLTSFRTHLATEVDSYFDYLDIGNNIASNYPELF